MTAPKSYDPEKDTIVIGKVESIPEAPTLTPDVDEPVDVFVNYREAHDPTGDHCIHIVTRHYGRVALTAAQTAQVIRDLEPAYVNVADIRALNGSSS